MPRNSPLTKVLFSSHESTVTASKANVLPDRPFSQLTVSEIFKAHIKPQTSNGNYFP